MASSIGCSDEGEGMKAETLAICVAYEQGYLKGIKKRHEAVNPYLAVDQDTEEAWIYGYSEGYRHAFDVIGGEG